MHDSFFTDYTITQINTDKNNKDSLKNVPQMLDFVFNKINFENYIRFKI